MKVSGRKFRRSLLPKIISSQNSLPKNAMKGNINGFLKKLCNYMEVGLITTNKYIVQEAPKHLLGRLHESK